MSTTSSNSHDELESLALRDLDGATLVVGKSREDTSTISLGDDE